LDIATDEPIPCGTSPHPVDTPLRFTSVSAGLLATCGMSTDGAAYCWGWDQWDQGGDGTRVTGPAPTPVATPPDLVTVVAGAVTGCGLDPIGAAYCWGTFPIGRGQAGNGNPIGEPTPDAVIGGHAFTWVGSSDANNIFQFTCGIDTDGAAWCWGSNSFGQLGTDDTLPLTCTASGGRSPDCTAEPVAVEGGLTWESVDLDSEYTCGIAAGGVPYCWGSNTWGNLGDGTKTNHAIPAPVLLP
jgi:alpha-tubulin suppressor-like RCC1 family protein